MKKLKIKTVGLKLFLNLNLFINRDRKGVFKNIIKLDHYKIGFHYKFCCFYAESTIVNIFAKFKIEQPTTSRDLL